MLRQADVTKAQLPSSIPTPSLSPLSISTPSSHLCPFPAFFIFLSSFEKIPMAKKPEFPTGDTLCSLHSTPFCSVCPESVHCCLTASHQSGRRRSGATVLPRLLLSLPSVYWNLIWTFRPLSRSMGALEPSSGALHPLESWDILRSYTDILHYPHFSFNACFKVYIYSVCYLPLQGFLYHIRASLNMLHLPCFKNQKSINLLTNIHEITSWWF